MARKQSVEIGADAPEPTGRIMVTRRLPRDLWTRLQDYVATIEPRTTDTAILELALTEYLDRQEGKKRK